MSNTFLEKFIDAISSKTFFAFMLGYFVGVTLFYVLLNFGGF